MTNEELIKTPIGAWVRKPEVVGFQPYWLVGSGKQNYSDTISTLTYFGLAVQSDGTIRKLDNPGESEPGWRMVNSELYEATLSSHRKSGTKLSLLIQNMNEEEILELIAQPELHGSTLVGEVAPIMQKHGFTDLNLDIESFTIASESTRMNYVRFVQAVKDELTRLQLGTLTVELTPKSPIEMHLIDVAKIGEIADFLVLMAYDYHYIYSSTAGPVAPVGGVPTVAEYDVETAVKETLRHVPPSKVILGVPLYGYEWETLRNSPFAPVIPGSWQVATGKRLVPLAQSCEDCIRGFDEYSQEPYLIHPGERSGHFQQIYYENKEALQAKINLANTYQLAGVAMWALGYESAPMMAPISVYKNTVQYTGISSHSTPDYRQVQPAGFILVPPTTALVGSVATHSGEMKKFGRMDSGFVDIDVRQPLVQGESLYAGVQGSARVVFPNIVEITMSQMSELSFVNLVPASLFLRQKSGTVSYTLIDPKFPWSVRVLHTLVELSDGQMEVMIDGELARLTLVRGLARIGAVDTNNDTTVYTIEAGDLVSIDQSLRSISISKKSSR